MWVGLQCAVLRSVNRLLNECQEKRILTALEDSTLIWPRLSAHKNYVYECKLQSSTVAKVTVYAVYDLFVKIVTIATGRIFYWFISLLFKCH